MKRWQFVLSAALVAALAALAFTSVSLADKKEYWKGRPEIKEGEVMGYFIWEDSDGFHARWTTKGGSTIFSGSITCDGEFLQFEPVKKDKRDLIKKDSGSKIRFDTKTHGGVDGLDFRVSPSTRRITFDLMAGGAKAVAQSVRLGEKKERPASMPFTIDRSGGSSALQAPKETQKIPTTKETTIKQAPAQPKGAAPKSAGPPPK